MLKLKQFFLSLSLSLSLSLGISLLAFNPFVFADETLTITTYYPSPYGSYSQLQSNQLSVGDTNADSQMTSADLPPANGQIYAARGIILKPQSSLPSTDLVTGEVVYNNSDKKLYSYDGSAWAALGGGGASFTYYCNLATDVLPTPSNICTNAGGTQGYCPSGFKQIYDLGSWGYCDGAGNGGRFRPPGGGCVSPGNLYTGGEAYVCSQ